MTSCLQRTGDQQTPRSFKLPSSLSTYEIFSISCYLHFTLTTYWPAGLLSLLLPYLTEKSLCFQQLCAATQLAAGCVVNCHVCPSNIIDFSKGKMTVGWCRPPGTLTTAGCSRPNASKLYGSHLHLRKIRTQCKPNCLQTWSGRSDHNPIVMLLHLALTCVFPYLDNLSGVNGASVTDHVFQN